MIKTNVLMKTRSITFGSPNRDLGEYNVYKGKSFELIEGLEGKFIDWVNGGISEISGIPIGEVKRNEPAWDVKFFGREFTEDLREYVQNKILQKLNIHREELNYKFENTDEIGIPYLDKLTEEELNFFIREAIMEVIGAREITNFKSEIIKDSERQGKTNYIVKFEVMTEGGDMVWQSIEI